MGKEEGSEDSLASRLRVQLSSIKSCPADGFVWRLSVVLSHCLHVLGATYLKSKYLGNQNENMFPF